MYKNINETEEHIKDALVALETIRSITKNDYDSAILNVFITKIEKSILRLAKCNLEKAK